MQDFRKLKVFQRSHALSKEIRKLAAGFPSSGYSKFKTQITDAAESIASNIVEGAGAPTKKEFARFLGISIKSSLELEYRLELALDDGLIGHALWERLTNEVIEIRKMLFGLRKRVLGDDD
jgi:four helix bundle protein